MKTQIAVLLLLAINLYSASSMTLKNKIQTAIRSRDDDADYAAGEAEA